MMATTETLRDVLRTYALRKDVGFTGEQIFVLFRYTFGHPMIDVLAIRQTYLLSEIFGNANVLCFSRCDGDSR
jgi:hypothetical protein